MTAEPPDVNGVTSSQTTMQFSYKNVIEHARCLGSYWKSFLVAGVGVFGVLWCFASASVYFLEADLRGWQFYVVAVVVSLAAALGRILHVYVNDCPEGLESESAISQRIAQIQRPLWEFRLARQLLEDKLGQLDNELKELLEGRIFVPVEKRLRLLEYPDWTETRLVSVSRMCDVAMRLLISDFSVALRSRKGQEAEPAAILLVINQIRDLYAETVSFEQHNNAVLPPEAFKSLHSLQRGWTTPIRDGIQQMYRFLDQMVDWDPNKHNFANLTITFDEPPNVGAFCQELARLSALLPELIDDE